jgi:hypothetical protein
MRTKGEYLSTGAGNAAWAIMALWVLDAFGLAANLKVILLL